MKEIAIARFRLESTIAVMKIFTRFLSIFPAILISSILLADQPDIRPDRTDLPMNQAALKVAMAYKDGGKYNSKWTGSGTPERIVHDGVQILAAGTDGTYCSGFTFATAMSTAQKAGLLKGKPVDAIRRFQKEWYGAVSEPEIREKQCALAVGHLGIGREVSADEAQAGDFLQFWRTKSGHSVVFLGWVNDEDGKRIGFKYRSSQGSTHGIGNTIEYFQGMRENGYVNPERMYFARLEKNSETKDG